jgi:carboxyl-terminal processing protease
MEIQNSKKTIFTPLVIGLSLIIGIIIGNKYIPVGSYGISQSFISKPDKLTSIIQLIKNKYVDNVSTDSIEETAIPEILKHLDPHSVYIPAKEMAEVNEPLEGEFDGIGVQFNLQNDTIYIIATVPGGPSEKQGVAAGDRIITINDTTVAGVKIKNDQIVGKLKGKNGTKVKIGVKRHGIKDLIHFEITRDKIPINSVDAYFMATKDIGYIKISKFARTTYDEFIKAANQLKELGMKKLILDLRQNGGGYLNAAVDISDEFLSDGKMIVFTRGSKGNHSEYKATGKGMCENMNLDILIDSWTASASEIVSGAMQDNDRAVIIGRRSFGKGLVQESAVFPDGSGIRLTIARYYTPSGRCIQKPYNKGEENYEEDIYRRSHDGELNNADSTHFSDSLKFKTLGGKTVYGGGGIMPDIFVPIDTSFYSTYFKKITHKNSIYNFALTYSDIHRKLLSTYKTFETLTQFLEKQNVESEFLNTVKKQGINPSPEELKISQTHINQLLYAYIIRNILNENEFYHAVQIHDKDFEQALKNFNE